MAGVRVLLLLSIYSICCCCCFRLWDSRDFVQDKLVWNKYVTARTIYHKQTYKMYQKKLFTYTHKERTCLLHLNIIQSTLSILNKFCATGVSHIRWLHTALKMPQNISTPYLNILTNNNSRIVERIIVSKRSFANRSAWNQEEFDYVRFASWPYDETFELLRCL